MSPLGKTEAEWLTEICRRELRSTPPDHHTELADRITLEAKNSAINLPLGLRRLGYAKLIDFVMDQLEEDCEAR